MLPSSLRILYFTVGYILRIIICTHLKSEKMKKKEDDHEEIDNVTKWERKRLTARWSKLLRFRDSRWNLQGIFDDRYLEFAYVCSFFICYTRTLHVSLLSVIAEKAFYASSFDGSGCARPQHFPDFTIPIAILWALSLLETAPVASRWLFTREEQRTASMRYGRKSRGTSFLTDSAPWYPSARYIPAAASSSFAGGHVVQPCTP